MISESTISSKIWVKQIFWELWRCHAESAIGNEGINQILKIERVRKEHIWVVDSHSPSGKKSLFTQEFPKFDVELLRSSTMVLLCPVHSCLQRRSSRSKASLVAGKWLWRINLNHKSSWLQINHALGVSWYLETSYSKCCFNPPLWMLSVFSNKLAHVGFVYFDSPVLETLHPAHWGLWLPRLVHMLVQL